MVIRVICKQKCVIQLYYGVHFQAALPVSFLSLPFRLVSTLNALKGRICSISLHLRKRFASLRVDPFWKVPSSRITDTKPRNFGPSKNAEKRKDGGVFNFHYI